MPEALRMSEAFRGHYRTPIARLSHGENGEMGPVDRRLLEPDNLIRGSPWGWDEDLGRPDLMLSEHNP